MCAKCVGHAGHHTLLCGTASWRDLPAPACSVREASGTYKCLCVRLAFLQVLLGGKPAVLDTPWKPAQDTKLILALVAAVQAQHWPVLENISTPEAFSKAWDFYLLVGSLLSAHSWVL